MQSRVKAHNFKSTLLIMYEMLDIYSDRDESDYGRGVIRDYIYSFLRSAKSIYYDLSIKDKLALNKELKEFKRTLKNINYLESIDLQKTCKNIRMINFRNAWNIVKNLIPLKLRKFIKDCILKAGNKRIIDSSILAELKKTYAEKRIILIGTPVHSNLGDYAIALAEREIFSEFIPEMKIIEIVMPEYRALAAEIKKYVNKEDIIVISGGGWLGTLWKHDEEVVREVVSSYPDNKIVILPQTIYFEDTEEGRREKEISKEIYSAHKNLIFCLRDKASYELALNNKFVQDSERCLYLPDMALALNPVLYDENRDGILLCFRADREKRISFRDIRKIKKYFWERNGNTIFTTTAYCGGIPLEKRNEALNSKLKEFASARLVITDRLHAMIFAAITATPCIAFDNLTGKVKGVYEWIKNLEYIKLSSNIDEAIANIDVLLKKSCYSYDNSAIRQHFMRLVSSILK